MREITQTITGVKVQDKAAQAEIDQNALKAEQEQRKASMNLTENPQRPEMLVGSTYKIKPPVSEHALYITINDILLNQGTAQEVRRPFEIFVNSKNMEFYSWIVALTRVISAVFRKGGDCTF